MEAKAFIEQAKKQISSNPLDRVSKHIKEIRNDAIYDPHCHIFDKGCVPVGYFILRLLTKPFFNAFEEEDNLLVELENTDSTSKIVGITVKELYQKLEEDDDITFEKVEKEVNREIEKNEDSLKVDKALINKLTNFSSIATEGEIKNLKFELEIAKSRKEKKEKTISGLKFIIKVLFSFKNNKEIFELYLDQFAIKNLSPFKEAGKPFITGILMMDIQAGWEFKRQRKSITEQMDELLLLTEEVSSSANPIIPFFAVHPARADFASTDEKPNLYDLFLKAFPKNGTSFFGVKIYPCLGYLPSDPRLRPIYEICEAKNIPILTHCGGNFVTTYERKTSDKLVLKQNFDDADNVEIEFEDRRDMGDFLNQPEHWLPVLTAFPNLKINIAHFGSPTAWNNSLPAKTKITANSTNIPQFKSFTISSRKNTIIALMKQFKGVYADFAFNISEEDTFTNLLNELNKDPLVKARTMFGTDFWVVLSNTLLFKDKLNTVQQTFIDRLSKHNDSLYREVPHNYLFDTSHNDLNL